MIFITIFKTHFPPKGANNFGADSIPVNCLLVNLSIHSQIKHQHIYSYIWTSQYTFCRQNYTSGPIVIHLYLFHMKLNELHA